MQKLHDYTWKMCRFICNKCNALNAIVALIKLFYPRLQWFNAYGDRMWKVQWKYSGNWDTCKTCSFYIGIICSALSSASSIVFLIWFLKDVQSQEKCQSYWFFTKILKTVTCRTLRLTVFTKISKNEPILSDDYINGMRSLVFAGRFGRFLSDLNSAQAD